MAGIALKNLVKTFGAYTAVSGISLDIRDGEFLIMVGPIRLRQDDDAQHDLGSRDADAAARSSSATRWSTT